MTFNAASRLRSLEDRSAALGSRRCELPGMHSVPKSAVLPYASGVGGLSRRLLIYIYICRSKNAIHNPGIHIQSDCFQHFYLSIYLSLLLLGVGPGEGQHMPSPGQAASSGLPRASYG